MKLDRFGCGLEVKFAPDSDAKVGKFSGYGSIFGNMDGGGDLIERGAFKETLAQWEAKGKYPPMLLQHGGFFGPVDDALPIGKWTSMEENAKGLKVEGELYALGTERGTYIYEGLKAGTLDGLSIGYRVKAQRNGTKPEEPRRTLTAIELVELSVVTFPMNDKARISSVKAEDITERDFERWLMRDAGFTRSEAIVVINEGFKALRRSTRDAGGADAALIADMCASAKKYTSIFKP